MASSSRSLLVRYGVWLLPLYALLTFEGTLTHQPDPDTAFPAYAAYISTTRFLTEHLVASIGGTVLAILGVFALFLYFMDHEGGSSATIAVVSSVIGNALLLPIFGVAAFTSPAIGDAYLSGQQNVVGVNQAIYGTPLVVTALVAGVCYSAGWILFGIAIWHSRLLPRWTAIPLGCAGPLISIVGLIIGQSQTVGTILLLVSTGWIAWSIWHQLAPGAAGPRVATDGERASPARAA